MLFHKKPQNKTGIEEWYACFISTPRLLYMSLKLFLSGHTNELREKPHTTKLTKDLLGWVTGVTENT